MRKRFLLPLCLSVCLFGGPAPKLHAQDAPAPEAASADAFMKLLEQFQHDPVARASAREALQKRLGELRETALDPKEVAEVRASIEADAKRLAELNARASELNAALESATHELEQLEAEVKSTRERLDEARKAQAESATPLFVLERSLDLLNALGDDEPTKEPASPAPSAEQPSAEPSPEPAPAVEPSADSKPPVRFNHDIRPILSNNCFACHGPDAKQRKAGLRLDEAEGAGKVFVPGDRARSELFQRITSSDPDEMMPPPSSEKKLTREQVELLGRWIDQGGRFEKHWAFIAPGRPEPPAVSHADWPRNDVDRFVLARLEKEGLEPSPEADKPTLLRRVTLDLTGLPPTPEELDAFLQDDSPDAYEKAVDRLLASPR